MAEIEIYLSGIAERLAEPEESLALDARRQRFRRDARRRRLLAGADFTAICVAAAFFSAIGSDETGLVLVATSPIWLVLAKVCGLYDADHKSMRHLTTDELPRIVLWVLVGSAFTTLVGAAFDLAPLGRSNRILSWLVLIVLAPAARVGARAIWRAASPPERVVVLGEGPLAEAVLRKLSLFRDMHATVVGSWPTFDSAALRSEVPWRDPIDRIVLASSSLEESAIADLLWCCRQRQIKLSVLPPARGLFGTAVKLENVAGVPVIEYHTWDTSRTSIAGKRMLDVSVAAVLLVALLPLFLVLAAIIRLTSKGSPIFVQERAGKDGVTFRMLKFRTMQDGAEERLDEVVDLDGLAQPAFKLVSDPRTTWVGRFLRRWSLDELPQLWNVLVGEMSLVGPRPEQVELVERYAPEHRFRLAMKPGMTGPMQVFGRGALGFEERLAVERDYIEQFSLSRDLRIIALTLAAVVRGDGAY